MAQITFKGNSVHTVGELPTVGSQAPAFTLTNNDLEDVSLDQYRGKKIILNIFPSLDTSVCATTVRKFNSETKKLDNTVVLCVSADLPFAQKRFCETEGLEDVEPLSTFRSSFGEDYGVAMQDGPLAGLMSRAVVILDPEGKVIHTEQVPEIAEEPNYEAAMAKVG